MEKTLWTEKFSVGVQAMDKQHKRIIDMINSLIRCEESAAEPEVVTETLTRMIQYAREHFKHEERLMKEHSYPALDVQRNLHREFLLKTISFGSASELRVAGVPDRLQTYLREWWTHHVLDEDMKYKTFFEQRGVS